MSIGLRSSPDKKRQALKRTDILLNILKIGCADQMDQYLAFQASNRESLFRKGSCCAPPETLIVITQIGIILLLQSKSLLRNMADVLFITNTLSNCIRVQE